jgi:UDP-N-acetyl-D-glucosamine dehydrogenase
MNPESKTVGIIGLGYVGQPTVAAFLKCGYKVIGLENDPDRVQQLNNGVGFVHEPGVAEQFKLGKSRLIISSDYAELRKASAIIITVGTPLDSTGPVKNISRTERHRQNTTPYNRLAVIT